MKEEKGQNRMAIHRRTLYFVGYSILVFAARMSTNQNQIGFATAIITMITIKPVDLIPNPVTF